ncbi:MAG: endonuclease/exonuclease/phosphatase family protein [Pseudomonadota bacterium]
MKAWMVIAAAVSAVALLATPAAAQEPPRKLRIMSWNLEHLAEKDGQGCRPRTEADYAAMRAFVAAVDPDIVAFQEVESLAAAARVFPPETYILALSFRPESRRSEPCGGLPGQTIRRQDVGFAIRRGLPASRNSDIQQIAGGDPDLRWGVDVSIQGAPALRLLNLHLKSGCPAGTDGRACEVLLSQTKVVERWLDIRSEAGEAVVILGDFNRRLLVKGDVVRRSLDDGAPAAASLTFTAGEAKPACDPEHESFIDHILLNAPAATAWTAGDFREWTWGEGARLSDHCPITVDLAWTPPAPR